MPTRSTAGVNGAARSDAPAATTRSRRGSRRAELVPLAHVLPEIDTALAVRLRLVERLEASRPELEDAETDRLVARCQRSDQAAFVALYERYADEVLTHARSIVGSREDAQDVTQDVFLRVLGGLAQFERRGVPFRAWLMTITRNVALTRRERAARSELVACAEIFDRAVVDDVPRATLSEDGPLSALVTQLPHAQRQVVVLRYLAELSPGETAALLKRSPDAVRQLECRALRSLRLGLSTQPPHALDFG